MIVSQGRPDIGGLEDCAREMAGRLPIRKLLVSSRTDPSLDRRVRVSLMLGYRF